MARFPDSPNVLKVLPGPIRTARTSEKIGPFADAAAELETAQQVMEYVKSTKTYGFPIQR